MLNPRSLSVREADLILAYKRHGQPHSTWGRIAERAGLPLEAVEVLADLCVILVYTDRTPQMNIQRRIVEAVLAAIEPVER